MRALKVFIPYAVLYAFLKDGHYNHSPQFHPIEVLGQRFSLCYLRVLCASVVV